MIRFLRKKALLLLFLFSIVSNTAYAANFDDYIAATKGKLDSALRTDSELYPTYDTAGKNIVDSLIQNFETNATKEEKTTTATQGGVFVASVLDSLIRKLETERSQSTTPDALKNVIRQTTNTAAQISLEVATAELSSVLGGASGNPVDNGGAVAPGNSTQPTPAQTKADAVGAPTGCNPFPGQGFDITKCVDGVIGWFVRVTLVNIALSIFYLASLFLHFNLYYGLVSMKGLVSQGIYTLWLFTRNLVFTGIIFSFLYFIGMYLVGRGQSIARASASVMIFTILSGFSFSACTGLVDVSNMVTISLYSSVSPAAATSWSSPVTTEPTIGTEFMKRMGYTSFSKLFTGPETNSILGSGVGSSIATNLLLAATMLYNAFIVLMMGILFMVRDLGLLASIIFSPLLFVDQAIPKLGDAARWFRRFFFGQLAVGPVFMLLMYIGLRVTDVITTGLSNVPKENYGVVFFNLIAITAVFHYSYKACKQLSGVLADTALGALGGIASKAMIATPIGAAGRLASFAGKNTIGRLGQAAANRLQNSDIRGTYFGDKLYGAAKYAGYNATYDFNNSKVFANAQTAFAQKTGFNPRGGFVNTGKSYTEAREVVRKDLDKDLDNLKDVTDDTLRANLMERRAQGKYFRSNSTLDPSKDTPDYRRLSLMTDKEKKEALDKRTKLTKETKSEFTDSLDSLDLIDYPKKSAEEKKQIAKKINDLLAKAEKSGDETKKWFDEHLKRRLTRNVTDNILSDTTLDPLKEDYADKAKEKRALYIREYASVLANDQASANAFEEELKKNVLKKKRTATEDAATEEAYRKRFTPVLAEEIVFPTIITPLETPKAAPTGAVTPTVVTTTPNTATANSLPELRQAA